MGGSVLFGAIGGLLLRAALARSRILHTNNVFWVLVNCVMNSEFNTRGWHVFGCFYLFILSILTREKT